MKHERKVEDGRLKLSGGGNTVYNSKMQITGNRPTSTSCQHNLTTAGWKVFLFVSKLSSSRTSIDVSDHLKSFYDHEEFSIEKLKARFPDILDLFP